VIINIKSDLINKFIIEPLQPIFDFFKQYGITEMTVIGVPLIIIFLITIRKSKMGSPNYITTIIVIAILSCAIVYYQFIG